VGSCAIYLICYAKDSCGISLQGIYLKVINLILNSDKTMLLYELCKDEVLSILNTCFKTYVLYTYLTFFNIVTGFKEISVIFWLSYWDNNDLKLKPCESVICKVKICFLKLENPFERVHQNKDVNSNFIILLGYIYVDVSKRKHFHMCSLYKETMSWT
jgi:hypothetical protein